MDINKVIAFIEEWYAVILDTIREMKDFFENIDVDKIKTFLD